MGLSSTSKTMGSPFFWGILTGMISSLSQPSLRPARPLVAHEAELILFFPGDTEPLRDVLGSETHMVTVEDFPDPIEDHEVNELGIEHAGTPSCCGQDIGGQAHVLHTARYDDVCVARHNGLGADDDGTSDRRHRPC